MRHQVIAPRLANEGIGDLYPRLLHLLLTRGFEVSPRGFKTRELLGVQLHADDLTKNVLVHPVRDLNYRFMVAEWAWIMAGRQDLAALLPYNKNYGKFSDDGKTLAGAYGPRLRLTPTFQEFPGGEVYKTGIIDQLNWCVEQLRRSPETRQAVATVWTPCPGKSKDIPCTISAQFFLRDHLVVESVSDPDLNIRVRKLHTIFTMRSSDAWLGIPYDWFTFTQVANSIAGELGAVPGGFTLQLGSSHLYEENWQKATELIAHYNQVETVESPRLPGLLPPAFYSHLLDHDVLSVSMGEPWTGYVKALVQPSKKEALDVLRKLAR